MKSSEIDGVDLGFRPKSYFWPLGLEAHLLARIKGAERKASLKHLIDAGRMEDIPDWLSKSALSDDERKVLGRIHPAFMGGEYLPDLLRGEVMIARITIASTTQDVTCVYARRGKNRIYYRVVDEYEGETLCGRTARTSARPLTLAALEEFFNGAWSVFSVLGMNFRTDECDERRIQRFVVAADSSFYTDFEKLYRARIHAWAEGRRPRDPISAEVQP